MKIKLLFITLFLMASQMASAQFEGHIEMKLYSQEGNKVDENLINMYVNKDRIAIFGEDDVKVSGMSSSGLIIRNDMQDFVFLTDDKTAFKITRNEIDNILGMVMMMDEMGGKSSTQKEDNVEPKISYTNKTKKINGIEASEMIIEYMDGKNKGGHLSVWLAPKVDINWGMLTESWTNVPEDMDLVLNGVFKDNVFKGGAFPVYAEGYDFEKKQTIKIFEVTKLEKTKVSADKIDVPRGVEVVGMNNFMQQMMMGN